MSSEGPVVFVVDDDESMREALSSLIRSLAVEVEVFASGAEFLKSADFSNAACAVLDVWMPDISGLELQRQLAAKGIDLPIVFLSGKDDVSTTSRAMEAGAVKFLPKPFQEQQLLDIIQEALERKQT